jgi:hypothetical protein
MLDSFPILLTTTIILFMLCISAKPSSAFLWGILEGFLIFLAMDRWIELFNMIMK